MIVQLFIYAALISFSEEITEQDNIPEYVPCDSGWYFWGGKCYKTSSLRNQDRVTWDKALAMCRNYGADLASIGSQAEQDFLSFLLLHLRAWTWIGLNDKAVESVYSWTDGTVFDYTNWKEDEPKGERESHEDCGHLWFEPEKDIIGEWNDISCDSKERFICEMKPNYRKRSSNPMYCSSNRRRGWHWENSCYHVVPQKKSWQDAEHECKYYYDGHLVSILDSMEDLFLDYRLGNISDEVWIGIKIQEQLQQKWTSGWYVSYDGLQKETHYKEGTCVARKKRGEWVTVPCTKELPFICKTSKDTPPVLKSAVEGSHCPTQFDGWRDLGGEDCYYFETEKAVSFHEASFDCKRKGGNLVSVHSKEEKDIIFPFLKYNRLAPSVWIGLFRLFPRAEEFAWTDGSAVDYENFVYNQPDNVDEICVEANINNVGYLYGWNDLGCDAKLVYICKVRKISPNSQENSDCAGFCIPRSTHLYEMVSQSPYAKRIPS